MPDPTYKYFVPDKKVICIKIGFCASTKVFEEAINAAKFLGWLKIFGPAQNILRPVKGQDASASDKDLPVHIF